MIWHVTKENANEDIQWKLNKQTEQNYTAIKLRMAREN